VNRPTLNTHMMSREVTQQMADDLFDVVGRGVVKIQIGQRYKLEDAAQAHIDLESRKTTGSSILTL
jgi:NADPH:quinone reductase